MVYAFGAQLRNLCLTPGAQGCLLLFISEGSYFWHLHVDLRPGSREPFWFCEVRVDSSCFVLILHGPS